MPRLRLDARGNALAQVHVRMPHDVFKAAEKLAGENDQTMNALIVGVLREAVMEACPHCGGSGVIRPTTNNKNAPAPVTRPGAWPIGGKSDERTTP